MKKLYKLSAFMLGLGACDVSPYVITDDLYFDSLNSALSYLVQCCNLDLPWAIALYDGFVFQRFVARGSYV